MDNSIEISQIAARLCNYTRSESGIAIVGHTDAGTSDLYCEGQQYREVLTDSSSGGPYLRLRARKANYYWSFDLISPMPLELFLEMAQLYHRLIQARLTPPELDEMLKKAGSG